jgi:ABC-type nitrate/sulfonate/bicarbonate transport system substrate-binding protein
MLRIRIAITLPVLFILFIFVLSSKPAGADPLKIRAGGVAPYGDLVEILFAKPEIARHLGKSYDYVPIHFAGTPPIMTAVASGDLDVAVFSYSSFGLAIENAKMDDIRVIMDGFQDGAPGYYSDGYMVRNDSPIRTIDDLKGKVLATPGIGTARDIALRVAMRAHHLEEKKDYTIIEVGLSNMKSVLMEKKVDLISASTAMAQDPVLRANAHNLFTQAEAVGTTQEIVWAARKGFLDKNRAAMVDFLEDALRARRFYFDPANRAEAIGIVARAIKQDPAALSTWLFTHHDYYRDPNGLPNLEALQANIDVLTRLGFLKTHIDVRSHSDLDLVREAARRLE